MEKQNAAMKMTHNTAQEPRERQSTQGSTQSTHARLSLAAYRLSCISPDFKKNTQLMLRKDFFLDRLGPMHIINSVLLD